MRQVLVLALALAIVPLHAAAQQPGPDAGGRHSGTLVGVAADRGSVTLEEMIGGRGDAPTVVRRTLVLAPDAAIGLVRRAPDKLDGPQPGWAATPLAASDLRPGDFVTVTTRPGDGGRPIVASMDVVRPSAAE